MRSSIGSELLRRVLGSAFRSQLEREREFYRRFRELNGALEARPESITHYVLRGELFSERGEYERARADFEAAVAIAEAVDSKESWGLFEQVMRDRALQGIELAKRRR